MKHKHLILSRLAALAVLSASYINFGCAQEPTPSERLQKFHTTYNESRRTYKEGLVCAHSAFSNACLDGTINKSEQKEIFKNLDEAKKAKARFEDNLANAPERDSTRLEWTKRDETYLTLLDKNLHGFDGATPEFQKYLNGNGFNVKVEGCWSDKEQEACDAALEVITDVLLDSN